MTICIANEKGGSGKSTLCLNLAVQLLKDNKEVVVLDTDSQKSMETFATIRAEKERPTFSLLLNFQFNIAKKLLLESKVNPALLKSLNGETDDLD